MKLPVRHFDAVYHVGTLEPADRAKGCAVKGFSMEGYALSVSPCPHAWRRIAKLGGNPVHTLTKPDGRFLDIHEALADPDIRKAAKDWAFAAGYAEDRPMFRAWSRDDETEEWRYMFCATAAEAREEAGEEGPDGKPAVEPVTETVPLQPLCDLTGIGKPGEAIGGGIDAVIVGYAMSVLRDAYRLDGFYVNETYYPEVLSAPRGGIFQDSLADWAPEAVAWRDVPDDDDMLTEVPAVEWVDGGRLAPAP